jgi:hypothetical protein
MHREMHVLNHVMVGSFIDLTFIRIISFVMVNLLDVFVLCL